MKWNISGCRSTNVRRNPGRDLPTVRGCANALFASGATLRAVAAGSRSQLSSVARTMAVNKLRPVIARVFGFDEAQAALACFAEGRSFDRVVSRVAA